MHTSTLPVGSGSVVEFSSPPARLEPAVASPPSRPTSSGDLPTSVLRVDAPTPQPAAPMQAAPREAHSPPFARRSFPKRTCSLMGVRIAGVGSYVPDCIVTNADLRERQGFDPEWIEQRTGIFARRYAPKD